MHVSPEDSQAASRGGRLSAKLKVAGLLALVLLPFLRPTGDEARRVVFHLYSASYFGLAVAWAVLTGVPGGLWLAGGPRRRPRLLKAALLLFSCGLALVCVEVALHRVPRLVPAAVKARLAGGGAFLDFQDTAHTVGAEGVRFGFAPHQRETVLCAVSNRLGTMLPVRGTVPPGMAAFDYVADHQGLCNASDVTGRVDALTIGDSFAEMGHLPEASRWHTHLAKACGWTHRSLGKGGIGPTEGVRILKAFGAAHQPKQVIFSIFEGNDPWDEDTWLRWQASGRSYPDFLVHNETFQNRIILFKWYEDALERAFAPRAAAPGAASGERPEPRPEFMAPFAARLVLSPAEIQALPGWGSTLKAVDEAQAWCAARGARLTVVLWPSREHVYALHYAGAGDAPGVAAVGAGVVLDPSMAGGGRWAEAVRQNADTVHQLLAGHCRDRGIAFQWVLDPLLQEVGQGRAPYYLDDIHPNEAGNAAVGDFLGSRLGGGAK